MIKVLTVGPIEENTVILTDKSNKFAVVIDPGAEGERIIKDIEGLESVFILATHGHLDHVGQVGFIKEKLNIPFCMNKKDSFLISNELFTGFSTMLGAYPCPEPDIDLKEGDTIEFGDSRLEVIETPGHTPGSVCFYNRDEGYVVVGDTLFKGSVGRTDLPGGDPDLLMESLKKLTKLPDETVVICGHGPKTTIGEEKRSNPFITGRFRLDLW
ncbi:MBL fold metallo-hydrolase [Persephonella sp.]